MQVLGLDVSKDSATGAVLQSKPENVIDEYFNSNFFKFTADIHGIRHLLSLNPDVVILEPTGKYSYFWVKSLAQAGVEVRLVGHKELRYYRANYSEEKSDELDAMMLACYYFDFAGQPRRFLFIRHPIAARLRELSLKLHHLNRIQNPIINNLRQELSWQFPEVASVQSERSEKQDIPLLWGWIAGLRDSNRYERKYSESAGFGLNETTKFAAHSICNIQQQEAILEREMLAILERPELTPYHAILDEFGFGPRVRAVLLSQVFPFDKFLENGQPVVIVRPGKLSGKPTKRYLSERRFLKTIGCAPTKEQSGKMKKVKATGGSAICRRALWQWVFCSLETGHHPDSEVCQLLRAELLNKKLTKPVKLARSHVMCRTGKLLYKKFTIMIQSFPGTEPGIVENTETIG